MKEMTNNPVNNSYRVEVNGDTYDIHFDDGNATVVVNGESYSLDVGSLSTPGLFSMLLAERNVTFMLEPGDSPGSFRIQAGGGEFEAEVMTSQEARLREFIRSAGVAKTKSVVKAPMPGMIVKHLVAEGDMVRKGQGVTIMEAMKMENEIKSPKDGVVKRFAIEPGEAVDKGQVLFELE